MKDMQEAAAKLRVARSVAVVTGAGISVASGLRPYRGEGGMWDSGEVDPMEVASEPALQRDPETVIRYLRTLRGIATAAEPNAAHRVLAEMERHYPHFAVITQNVDGLHGRAGNEKLYEVHGSVARSRTHQGQELPDVVLFGGMLPFAVMGGVEQFLRDHPPDVMLVVGTTALFPYIQEWIGTARRRGAWVVEINLAPTEVSRYLADLLLQGRAEEVLPALWEQARAGDTVAD